MSTTQRVSGNLTIQTLNATDQITFISSNQINVDCPTVLVNGNLFVTGNSQTISSVDSAITNNKIILNSGTTVPNPFGANIIVARGTSANASIGWNESLQAWQIFNGATVSNIVTSSGAGIASVSADTTPALGGNLNLSGHTIYDNTVGGNVQLSATTPGTGGTGLRVVNTSYPNSGSELINKTRSIAYSILFG